MSTWARGSLLHLMRNSFFSAGLRDRETFKSRLDQHITLGLVVNLVVVRARVVLRQVVETTTTLSPGRNLCTHLRSVILFD